jgi:hypothetical protein
VRTIKEMISEKVSKGHHFKKVDFSPIFGKANVCAKPFQSVSTVSIQNYAVFSLIKVLHKGGQKIGYEGKTLIAGTWQTFGLINRRKIAKFIMTYAYRSACYLI